MPFEDSSFNEHGIEIVHEARAFEVTSAEVTRPCLQAERKHEEEERDLNFGIQQVIHVLAEVVPIDLFIGAESREPVQVVSSTIEVLLSNFVRGIRCP
jgi:hypothetical protein